MATIGSDVRSLHDIFISISDNDIKITFKNRNVIPDNEHIKMIMIGPLKLRNIS